MPDPVDPFGNVTKVPGLDAAHVHPGVVVTVTLPLPPDCPTVAAPADRLKLHVAGCVTVSPSTFEVIPLSDALMFVEPPEAPSATPVFEPILATVVFEELHVTWLVMFAVEPSL